LLWVYGLKVVIRECYGCHPSLHAGRSWVHNLHIP